MFVEYSNTALSTMVGSYQCNALVIPFSVSYRRQKNVAINCYLTPFCLQSHFGAVCELMVYQKSTQHQEKSERKRTSSDLNSGDEHNKKIRGFDDECLQQVESPDINNEKNGDVEKMRVPLCDPDCDPDHPRKIAFSDISSAAFNIKNGVVRTPCSKSINLSKMLDLELYFKKEYMQVTGSFKERGARYALMKLSNVEKQRGVIAASAGNHALALCYHGQQLNIPVTVVMPLFAPLMKIGMCRSFGANVILNGDDIGKAKEYAMRMVLEKKLKYINGYDAPNILAGQGTIGLEILEQVPDVDAIIVPVGGGGLVAGIAVAVKTLKPEVKIIVCSFFTRLFYLYCSP
ncbi:pyridoxal-phosphate dependent protein [Dictyocaulus viviparus]|uniref:Serine racemase n=1 Tax=Dictyocaulus viviparus TaxID=29172 RepID=A0A0D8XAC0_DICVI|nr:pyridoxal-phosphate dependent protein [Dictyocaulus viviparus]